MTGLAYFFACEYEKGSPFKGEGYKSEWDGGMSEQCVYRHIATDVRVWSDAIDVSYGAKRKVALFHFTTALGFANITNDSKDIAELYASMKEEVALFGQGIYTSSKEPAVFGSVDNILWNNYWTQLVEDDQRYARHDPRHRLREWRDRAAYCIPILASHDDVFDLSSRATPEMIYGPGKNRHGGVAYFLRRSYSCFRFVAFDGLNTETMFEARRFNIIAFLGFHRWTSCS